MLIRKVFFQHAVVGIQTIYLSDLQKYLDFFANRKSMSPKLPLKKYPPWKKKNRRPSERASLYISRILDTWVGFRAQKSAIRDRSNSNERISASFYRLASLKMYVRENLQYFQKIEKFLKLGNFKFHFWSWQLHTLIYIFYIWI